MKNMKSIAALMAPFLLADMGNMSNNRGRAFHLNDEPEPTKKIIPNGCAEYTFHGVTVIAVSEKSALKKIEKRLKRQNS